jgi:hypothetical protein
MPWYAKYRISHSNRQITQMSDYLAVHVDGDEEEGGDDGNQNTSENHHPRHQGQHDTNHHMASLNALDRILAGVSDGMTAVAMEFVDDWPTARSTQTGGVAQSSIPTRK